MIGTRVSEWPSSYLSPATQIPTELSIVERATAAAGWPGVVLPAARVLGVVVHPVVEFTGAAARVASGTGPQWCPATLELWEGWSGQDERPPSPLRIVGFVSTAAKWLSAAAAARTVAGLGAGMVLRRRRPQPLPLLDADATGIWVAGVDRGGRPGVWVRGRVGPLTTAARVTETRLMEEGLFAHSLACDPSVLYVAEAS